MPVRMMFAGPSYAFCLLIHLLKIDFATHTLSSTHEVIGGCPIEDFNILLSKLGVR